MPDSLSSSRSFKSRTLALTNATGRQSASLARAASAVGITVSAHIAPAAHKHSSLVASELASLPNTTIHTGSLAEPDFLDDLFEGADFAFVNTTSFDDEYAVGVACAEAALRARVKFLVYSSMPDHADAIVDDKGRSKEKDQAIEEQRYRESKDWHGLPHYGVKWRVEKYIRRHVGTPAAFVYTGIYYNNFTSLPYPLFEMREVSWLEAQGWPKSSFAASPHSSEDEAGEREKGRSRSKSHDSDGSEGDDDDDNDNDKGSDENDGDEGGGKRGRKCGFEWKAPFPPDVRLPWLDCEHDFGPAVLQILKDGPGKWAGKRVPLAFSMLDPPSVCAAFSRGLNRPVRYVEGPIEVKVPIPRGYQEQLDALQKLFGGKVVKGKAAPYWWEGLFEHIGYEDDDKEEKKEADRLRSDPAPSSATTRAHKEAPPAEKKKLLDGGKLEGKEKEPTASRRSSSSDGISYGEEDSEDIGDNKNGDDEQEERSGELDGADEMLWAPRRLWGGWRHMEGYAADAFHVEERLNGRTWMEDE